MLHPTQNDEALGKMRRASVCRHCVTTQTVHNSVREVFCFRFDTSRRNRRTSLSSRCSVCVQRTRARRRPSALPPDPTKVDQTSDENSEPDCVHRIVEPTARMRIFCVVKQ